MFNPVQKLPCSYVSFAEIYLILRLLSNQDNNYNTGKQ